MDAITGAICCRPSQCLLCYAAAYAGLSTSSAAWRRTRQHKRRDRMKITWIVVIVSLAVVLPAFGQQMSPADQEMTKVRQAMTNQYAQAIARKDAAAMADHYTADVVTA